MATDTTTTVRMFGALHSFEKDHGLPSETRVALPAAGCSARVLAQELELPLEKIEAVFVNHQVYSLDHCIHPGDRVAYIPTGPARGLLGIFDAGHRKQDS